MHLSCVKSSGQQRMMTLGLSGFNIIINLGGKILFVIIFLCLTKKNRAFSFQFTANKTFGASALSLYHLACH